MYVHMYGCPCVSAHIYACVCMCVDAWGLYQGSSLIVLSHIYWDNISIEPRAPYMAGLDSLFQDPRSVFWVPGLQGCRVYSAFRFFICWSWGIWTLVLLASVCEHWTATLTLFIFMSLSVCPRVSVCMQCMHTNPRRSEEGIQPPPTRTLLSPLLPSFLFL